MNTTRLLAVLLVTHMTTAAVAWLNGWLVGRFLERRHWEIDDLFGVVEKDLDGFLLQLTGPPRPYDWHVDDSGLAEAPPKRQVR